MTTVSATVPLDLARLKECFYYSIGFDQPNQLFVLGVQYSRERDDELAGACFFQLAAEKGHAQAQFHLAQCYFQGRGVEMNLKSGIHWLSESAHNGCVEAMYLLGVNHLNGELLPRDPDAARDWLARAAVRDYVPAMIALGHHLENPADPRESTYWLQRASGGRHVSFASCAEWREVRTGLSHPTKKVAVEYENAQLVANSTQLAS